jgi:predicted nucleic acid-binding protein
MPGNFFDTNVLLYLASADVVKADQAEDSLKTGGVVSVQVLNEFANVARRKMQMSWGETRDFLGMLRALLTVHPLTVETHESGLMLAERYGLSIYDAMIAASALHADCNVLLSEDMQAGLVIERRLSVRNPFK